MCDPSKYNGQLLAKVLTHNTTYLIVDPKTAFAYKIVDIITHRIERKQEKFIRDLSIMVRAFSMIYSDE